MLVHMPIDDSTLVATSAMMSVATFGFCASMRIKLGVSLVIGVVVGIILYNLEIIPIGLLAVVGFSMIAVIFKKMFGSNAQQDNLTSHQVNQSMSVASDKPKDVAKVPRCMKSGFNLRIKFTSLMRRIFSLRFLKFGTVGVSGIVINQGVLYVAQEYLFHVSHVPGEVNWWGLNLSLGLAIFFATLNNFFWNRLWTWADRKQLYDRPWLVQFGQYTLSCSLSIVLQAVFTNLMAPHVYYLIANFIAIVFTSVLNFVLNDIWTFGRAKILHSSQTRSKSSDDAA